MAPEGPRNLERCAGEVSGNVLDWKLVVSQLLASKKVDTELQKSALLESATKQRPARRNTLCLL
jgi:hypothetical protein